LPAGFKSLDVLVCAANLLPAAGEDFSEHAVFFRSSRFQACFQQPSPKAKRKLNFDAQPLVAIVAFAGLTISFGG
jgi:hypothetical protein